MTDWRIIVAEHGPDVWRVVYRILNHHDDAWDCYQEVFLHAFRSPPRAPVRDWGAFLGTLVARRAIDRLRQRVRLREFARAIEHVSSPTAARSSPSDRIEADELMVRVRRALATLPTRQAAVFWLSCVEDWPHDQIASQFGTTPGAVRMLLNRARSALAGSLNGLSIDPRSEP